MKHVILCTCLIFAVILCSCSEIPFSNQIGRLIGTATIYPKANREAEGTIHLVELKDKSYAIIFQNFSISAPELLDLYFSSDMGIFSGFKVNESAFNRDIRKDRNILVPIYMKKEWVMAAKGSLNLLIYCPPCDKVYAYAAFDSAVRQKL